MNRLLSTRSSNKKSDGSSSHPHRFTMASLRGVTQPEMSKKLYKLIKSENTLISDHESAGKERISIASQLSDWGEATGDDSLSEISDKLGVLLAEIGEQEDNYAANLEEYRGVLKAIRNTEASVQPTRDHKAKIADEIQKLKYKEPESTKIVTLEQELVRAEAQNLVAEAQLTNITRQKFKQAYDIHTAAILERAEKQVLLAKHARRLLNLLDDTPLVPGDVRPAFEHNAQTRQILADAEEDLREWAPNEAWGDVQYSSQGLGRDLMPGAPTASAEEHETSAAVTSAASEDVHTKEIGGTPGEGAHLAEKTEEREAVAA